MFKQRAQEPHHGQGRQIGVQLATGGGHFRSAVTDALNGRLAPLELANQISAVNIAAGLAGREKDFHALFACLVLATGSIR